MIVFDGSGSMAELGFNLFDEPRIFTARRAVGRVIPEIAELRRLGLVIYGPGGADRCAGVDLRFAPIDDAAPRIIGAVDGLQPDGDTALTDAVRLAAKVLGGQGTVVLVTDGKDTCGGEPCALAEDLVGGDARVTVHVIGFKVRGDFFDWDGPGDGAEIETVARCLADRTGGHYEATETAEELIEAFRRTLGCDLMF
ncbi:VWA domain-containing protein [Jannaschia formosa]|nr:VWA domain-containing protein [Jannaschia formosa]